MNKKNTKKMFAYSAMATAFLAAEEGQAQVEYTDLDPDSVLSASVAMPLSFGIDFNGDGDAEFSAVHINSSNGNAVVAQFRVPLSQNIKAIGSKGAYYVYPTALNKGDKIDAQSPFDSLYILGLGSQVGGGMYGNFLGKSAYVGVKLNLKGDTHYGWVEAEVSSDASVFTIKSYAYETQPDTRILAGDTGTTVSTVYTEQIAAEVGAVTPNPVEGHAQLSIQLEKATEVNYTVSNMLGQVLYRKELDLPAGAQQLPLDTEALATGQYTVAIQVGSRIITRKFMVK